MIVFNIVYWILNLYLRRRSQNCLLIRHCVRIFCFTLDRTSFSFLYTIIKRLYTPFFRLFWLYIPFVIHAICGCRLLLQRKRYVLNHGEDVHFTLRRRSLIQIWNILVDMDFFIFLYWVSILFSFQVWTFRIYLSLLILRCIDLFLFGYLCFSPAFTFLFWFENISLRLLTYLWGQITAHLL